MGQHIDAFCEDLREKLTGIDDALGALKSSVTDRGAQADEMVREHLGAVKSRIEQQYEKVVEANRHAKTWIEEKKDATEAEIATWKQNHERQKLERRAERAEDYARAASELAAAAIDEAEAAALEAWLARSDADSAG